MKIRFLLAPLIITASILFFPLSGGKAFVYGVASASGSSFYDVPEDTVFYPYIQKLYDAHLITGDTDDGKETYRYRPKDSLTRAEFTKVAVGIKLAEKYGVKEDWQSKSAYEITETVLKDKLLYFHGCSNADLPNCTSLCGADICGVCNVCQLTNEKPFTDVAVKSRDCEEEGVCTPWYSEYIYYALRKGMLQGYREGSSYAFHPNDPILRIHALKLIMADSGAVDPEADERYRRLSQTAKSRGSYYPKCLSGAENIILSQNGGKADGEKLLKYALLADKLDFFGSSCQVFNEAGARTPEQRADFLQKPLTRREVARYFVLSSSYNPLRISATEDPTVEEAVSLVKDPDASAKKTVDDSPSAANPIQNKQVETKQTEKKKPNEIAVSVEPTFTVPGDTFITSSPFHVCLSPRDCITLPPGSSLTYGEVFTDKDGLWQEMISNGRTYRVVCAEILTIECRDRMTETANGKTEGGIVKNTVLVASTADYYSPVSSSDFSDLKAVVDSGAKALKKGGYLVYPNKKMIWLCTDIRDNNYAKSPAACQTTVKKGEPLKTIGGVITGRRSGDGKTNLWQKVSYNGLEYYALLRDLDFNYTNIIDVAQYVMLRLASEKDSSIAKKLGSITSYDGVPDAPNWAEPINVLTGNFWSEESDLSIPARGLSAKISRTYNSLNPDKGPFGTGWSFEYNVSLKPNSFGQIVLIFGDGHQTVFSEGENGIFESDDMSGDLLKKGENFYYLRKDGKAYEFSKSGFLLSIKDKADNALFFERDSSGLISRIKDISEVLFSMEYDDKGYIKKATDIGGRTIKYSYKNDDLTKVCRGWFSCYNYTYDDAHRLLTIRNEKGRLMIENKYDDENRVVRQKDVMGAVVTLEYLEGKTVMTDALGSARTHYFNAGFLTTAEKDELGRKKEFAYDSFGRLIKLTDKSGNAVTYEYDEKGDKISETDVLGNTTRYRWNDRHQLTSVTDPRDAVSLMEYDDDGNLTQTTDALGNLTLYEYDGFGQKISQTEANGTMSEWSYNANGTLKETIDPLGSKTAYEYDSSRRLVKTTDALGNTTAFKYNKNGTLIETVRSGLQKTRTQYDRLNNRTADIDANGGKIKYAYDDKNRLSTEEDPLGNKTEYFYDDNDHLVKTIGPMGAVAVYQYDTAGNMLSVTNALGGTIKYEYDANDNKTKSIDAEGGGSSFVYDQMNRLVKSVDAEGGVTEFFHDESGNLIKTVNAEGGVKTAEFDALNRLIKSVDEMGNVTEYKYDSVGNKIEIIDPNGNSLKSEYDLAGNLIAETDAEGNTVKHEYDALGRLVKTTDALGNITSTKYDSLGRVSFVQDALGNRTSFKYDKIGNRVASADANGKIAKFKFDKLNRLVKSVDLVGNTSTTKYDKAGNMTEVKDARGAVYRYEYDLLGRITKSVAPNGLISTFAYDNNDRQIKITADGKTSAFGYDKLGRLTSQKNTLGQTVSYEYDKLSRKIKEADQAGSMTTYAYNALGQNTAITNALGATKISTYDALGNVLSKTDFNGSTARYEYDKNGRVLALIDPAGNAVSYEYDEAGRQTAVIDPTGNRTINKYDELGHLVKTVNANGAGMIYVYNNVGDQVSQAKFSDDLMSQETNYVYDPLHRLISATDALGGTVRYKYDRNNNRTRITDQNGNITKTDFDKMNHPVKTVDPLGNTESWQYDVVGNMIAYTDKNGVTEFLKYDDLNRLTEKKKGSITLTQTYDALGNMTAIEDNSGRITVTYNPVGFIESVTDQSGNGSYFKYDAAGNLVKRSDITGTTDYRYNNNLVTKIAFTPKEGKPIAFDYSYNPLGQITQLTYPNRTSTDYTYDNLGRLASIKNGNELIMEYTYSAFDLKTKAVTMTPESITEETYAYDSVGRLTAWTKDGQTETYSYDPAYNRTAVTLDAQTTKYGYNSMNQLTSDDTNQYSYDNNGFLLTDGKSDYTWDAYGRLTRYNDGTSDASYAYDSLNRMITRNDTDYVYAGLAGQFVLESTTDKLAAYLYDMNGSPLASYNQNRPYAFLKNAHNDVAGSLNENGKLTDQMSYDVFGLKGVDDQTGDLVSQLTANSSQLNLSFQGQFSDPASGLSFLNARIYNPDTAQFLSPDPFPASISTPYTLNRYAYSHNDPVNYWDQTGMYDSKVHYIKTKDWSYASAIDMGFTHEMARQLALNIASFDQYHDKEWTLAPNDYANGNGQGNSLHFMNPERDQMSFGQVQPQYNAPGSTPTVGLRPTFLNNEFVDPLANKVVPSTTVPIYQMKSLSDFNSAEKADELSNSPTDINGTKLGTLTLTGGTVRQRLQYAVDNNDPRLFGIALHEYQDSFAHAGFDKWHGTSKDNDIYCEGTTGGPEGKCEIGASKKALDSLTWFDKLNSPMLEGEISREINTREALYLRDQLMREGTQYWMKKFMLDQADYYQKQISKTMMYNKQEKILNNANDVLKVEEEFGQYSSLKPKILEDWTVIDIGVYAKQGAGVGGAPCTTLDSFDAFDSKPGCGSYGAELLKQINR